MIPRLFLAAAIAFAPSLTNAQQTCYVGPDGLMRCNQTQRYGLFNLRQRTVSRPVAAVSAPVVRYAAPAARSSYGSSGSYGSTRPATPEEEAAHAVEVLSRPENAAYASKVYATVQARESVGRAPDCSCEDCKCGTPASRPATIGKRVDLAELDPKRVRLAELPPRVVRLAELPERAPTLFLAMK